MLRFLRIRRLAVIDEVDVEFTPGLNVLTGETGAGKSIVVEAVGLLLGGRASSDMVRTGEETATIEAVFERDGDERVVRREITAQGRSRTFIDGALATAGSLRALGEGLVELHGQHEHHTLLDPASHLAVLDAFAGLDDHAAATAAAFARLTEAREQLARAQREAADRDTRLEFASFQLGEIDRAAPRAGEDEELAAARQVLANAERIDRLCAESYAALYESDAAALAVLGGVWRRVGELAQLDPVFQPHLAARDAIKAQLEDLAHALRRYRDGLDTSADRLQQVEDRLALLERLKRKFGPTLSDVLARREALRTDVSDLTSIADRVAALEARARDARAQYVAAADTLSASRRRAVSAFATGLLRELKGVAMEQTRFEVRFGDPRPETAWSADGVDDLEFFVSPNPGEDLRPLARIASGGELSRIMLAIKTLGLAAPRGGRQVRGLVFDEVDAGISGRVAGVVGEKLRDLGRAFQVLCITHLPQIAACADTHFHIDKAVRGGRTETTVTRLDRDGRIEELSRLLGGAVVTAATRRAAADLLDAARAKGESEKAKARREGRS
jgi:DNA repair protein RecN (Recombination protein N)